MADHEIRNRVDKVFAVDFELAPEKLRPQAHIFTDLGLDSLDVVDLIVALQREFNIQVRDDMRVRQIQTLEDLYAYIETLKEEQQV